MFFRRNLRLLFLFFWGAAGCVVAAQAQQARAQEAPPQEAPPVVLELFTSQGCSSCPPADRLLGQLGARADVVAIAFHVTYWDSIGWPDPFGKLWATQRQRQYRAATGRSNVYTPQLMLNGRRDYVGSRKRRITKAIRDAQQELFLVKIEQTPEQTSSGQWQVLLPDSGQNTGRHTELLLDVILIGLLPPQATAVERGENRGKTLTNLFIADDLRHLLRWDGRAVTLPLPALDRAWAHVVVLVQKPDQGPIVGAGKRSLVAAAS